MLWFLSIFEIDDFTLYGTVNLKEQPACEFSLSRKELNIKATYGLIYVQWVFHCIMTDCTENILKLIRYMASEKAAAKNFFFTLASTSHY